MASSGFLFCLQFLIFFMYILVLSALDDMNFDDFSSMKKKKKKKKKKGFEDGQENIEVLYFYSANKLFCQEKILKTRTQAT